MNSSFIYTCRATNSPGRRGVSLHGCVLLVFLLLALPGMVAAQSPWRRTIKSPPFGVSTALLLTDGSVVCDNGGAFNGGTGLWCRLRPDSKGSYINGTWSTMPSLPAGYTPLYYASAVLADGRLVVIGGEYNGNLSGFTNKGAIYDPIAGVWANLAAPAAWANIGDAQCAVLSDGRFMLANPLDKTTAIMDPKTLTWTTPGVKNKNDGNDEEGWTLMANGKILTVDVNSLNSEIYDPTTDLWSFAAPTPVQLADVGADLEMGPHILRPDGTIIAFGATGHNAVYSSTGPLSGQWATAPDFPVAAGGQLDCADAPASILANGNVLVVTSPAVFKNGSQFFEWNGTTFTPVPGTANTAGNSSFVYRMLVLPTGEVMVTDGTNDVEIYTASNSPLDAWRPTVTAAPTNVTAGQTYKITGTQFNGLTQGAAYGDDAGSATNYPLVRLTSHADGSVSYQYTHDHTNETTGKPSMGVATGGLSVSTSVDISDDTANGDYDMVVVANGIASTPPRVITVSGGNILLNPHFELGPVSWTTTPYVINNDTFEVPHAGSWKAWLGGYGRTHIDTLSQTFVTPPKGITSVSFSFWLHIDTQEPTSTPHDKLTVQLKTASGTTTLATYSNADARAGYVKKTFDISAFKGQSVQILLTGVEDRVYATSFILDDFVVLAH